MTEPELNQILKQIQKVIRRVEFLSRKSSITASIDSYTDEVKKARRELDVLLELCEDAKGFPFMK